MTAVRIPFDLLAMMIRGVSLHVCSHDAQLSPSVMRAVGSSVSDDGASITAYVSRMHARQLLQDIAATGAIAAVFSEPASHRSIQVKATRATLRQADASDVPALERYLASMEIEVQRVGHPPPVTRAMLAHRIEDVVAITFAPEQAFEQTPGPQAGRPVARDDAR